MIYNTLFSASIVVFIFAMAKHVIALDHFLARMGTHHKELFSQLGSPRWSLQWGDPTFREAVKWIKRREFASLNDDELERHFKMMRRTNAVAVFAGVAAVGVVIVQTVMLGQ